MKKIKTALVSVFNKDGIHNLCEELHRNNISILSTGGTKSYIEEIGVPVNSVESITDYPSILGGRVKTLHPKIFGAILSRSENMRDKEDNLKYKLPKIDLLIVDLYPFSEIRKNTTNEDEIIEKIDIGGVSLIRAGAKNFSDVAVISSKDQYVRVLKNLIKNDFSTSLAFRKKLAARAFNIIKNYDTDIDDFFGEATMKFKSLRYGENPHQSAVFKGDLDEIFDQLNGKELSYNNLLDIDSAIRLISEFKEITFGIIKHNNACGIASSSNVLSSYKLALEADPISAFGGVLISNSSIDLESAKELNKLFFEILIAPEFSEQALKLLCSKKNRIILLQKKDINRERSYRNILNGQLEQDTDNFKNDFKNWKCVTAKNSSEDNISDLIFANKVVKHSKSNAIVLVKNKQMISSGVGQTSRVDALNFAIEKAKTFNLKLEDSVMASDAFFPFPDCVEIASKVGISSIVQPGGSLKDDLSIKSCDDNQISMFLTGMRHFYH